MSIDPQQKAALVQSYWAMRGSGQVSTALTLGQMLLEGGVEKELEESIRNYNPNIDIKLNLFISSRQPFEIEYQGSKKTTSKYAIRWAEIVPEDDHRPTHLYLRCWVEDAWGSPSDDPRLNHNKSFRLDRIKGVKKIDDTWREEGLDFLQVEFDLSGGLAYGYEQHPFDTSVEWVSGQTSMVKRVKRLIHSLFWFKLNNAHLILSGDMEIRTPGLRRVIEADLEKALNKIRQPEIWVIYHARRGNNNYLFPCPDGWAAAFIAWKKFKTNARYIPLDFGMPIPFEPKAGDQIYCVDYSVSKEILDSWQAMGCEVTIIDHHETQVNYLMGLGGFNLIADTKKCGAWLTWEYFFPEEDLPEWVRYVDYRDTGKAWQEEFEGLLPEYNEFFCGMRSLAFDFKIWEQETETDPTSRWIEKGRPLFQQRLEKIRTTVPKSIEIRKIPGGAAVPVLKNCSYPTETAAYLYEQYPEYPFYAFVSNVDDGEKWSLKSNPKTHNFDCQAYALKVSLELDPDFEGGKGHRNAASFSLPFSESEYWDLVGERHE